MNFWSFSLVGEATPFGAASCFWSFPQAQKLGNAPPNRALSGPVVLPVKYNTTMTVPPIL